MDGAAGISSTSRPSPLAVLLLAAVASGLLFWNLGVRYLWQDEAACAVLAERMFEHGRPLSWDGTNLITMDEFRPEEADSLPLRTGDAQTAIDYFVAKGDFKADTTWIGQPWGQFVLAGLSLELFGHGTWQARLLFALSGVVTVVLLFTLVRRRFSDPWMATLAAALLLGNVFWYLHARQARYYSPATLGLLLTFASYLRWQDGRRFGGTLFVLAAWTWFQQDFGSVWPVFGVLSVDALCRPERKQRRPVAAFGALLLTLLPFVFAYELFGRVKPSFLPWDQKFGQMVFNLNQYQLPLLVLPVLGWLAARGRLTGPERRVAGLAASIVVAQVVWMPTVGPASFYRYIVDCTPLSCLLVAATIVRGTEWLGERGARGLVARPDSAAGACGDDSGRTSRRNTRVLAALCCGGFLVSPLPNLPTALLVPPAYWTDDPVAFGWKPELAAFVAELGGASNDPNRAVVEYLQPRLQPGDEILVNYEDIPLMFYTDQPIRGGIPAFRVLDETRPAPRFLVYRTNVDFVHAPAFFAAIGRHAWQATPLAAPDIPWGNNPDPTGHYSRFWGPWPPIVVYERLDGMPQPPSSTRSDQG